MASVSFILSHFTMVLKAIVWEHTTLGHCTELPILFYTSLWSRSSFIWDSYYLWTDSSRGDPGSFTYGDGYAFYAYGVAYDFFLLVEE